MKEKLKKYKILIMIIPLLLLIVYIFSSSKIYIKKLDNDTYALNYDSTWKIKEKSKNNIVFKHHSGSKITIDIITLKNEASYLSIDDLIDEILYSIQKQNKNYKLLFNNSEKITKDEFAGYKILYENDKEQVMINTYKKSDKLVFISYEAKNNYFDILLDSVENIIYNLDIKDKTFDIKSNIKLKKVDINYEQNKNLDKSLKNTNLYEIASSNYYVKYLLPSNFKAHSLDSQHGNFVFDFKDDKNITSHIYLNTSILNRNIYNYLDKEESGSVFKSYEAYKKDKNYSNYEEAVSSLKSDYDSYIYKNSYYYNNGTVFEDDTLKNKKEYNENIELIYALNNNHIFVVKINSVGAPITENMINMIKVKSSENYSSFIKIEKEENNLIGRLQRYSDYSYDKIDKITIKIPDKYEEIDKDRNIYSERYYELNYNEDLLIYDYDVHYDFSDMSKEQVVKNINSFNIIKSYGDYKELTYSTDLTLNDKKFSIYDGGYTNLSGIMFTNTNRVNYYVNKKVLIYEMPNKGTLYIEINGNNKEISNDMLTELTNFIIEYN